jgi:restriction system protein
MPNILGMFVEKYWWLIPLLIIVSTLKTPWFKGLFGEWLVKISAKYLLDKEIYHAIHNVTLETPDGTTQIDHVFVSQYGIFVVETKNYTGWIFGSEHQPTWTQKIYKTTNKFQNPLRQNYKHLKALEAALDISIDKLHSVIVFVGGNTFKTDMPANVTYAGGYIRYIKSFTSPVITDAELQKALSLIQTKRLKPSFKTNQEHVKNVQARLDPTAAKLCPKCGSDMLLRTTKSGDNAGKKFWGCSQFPKCRTIQNV